MFIAALFTAAQSGNNPNVHQWINGLKKCNLFTDRLFTHKKERNSHTGHNMDEPCKIMLNEIIQIQKDTYHVVPLIGSTYNRQSVIEVIRHWRARGMGVTV